MAGSGKSRKWPPFQTPHQRFLQHDLVFNASTLTTLIHKFNSYTEKFVEKKIDFKNSFWTSSPAAQPIQLGCDIWRPSLTWYDLPDPPDSVFINTLGVVVGGGGASRSFRHQHCVIPPLKDKIDLIMEPVIPLFLRVSFYNLGQVHVLVGLAIIAGHCWAS